MKIEGVSYEELYEFFQGLKFTHGDNDKYPTLYALYQHFKARMEDEQNQDLSNEPAGRAGRVVHFDCGETKEHDESYESLYRNLYEEQSALRERASALEVENNQLKLGVRLNGTATYNEYDEKISELRKENRSLSRSLSTLKNKCNRLNRRIKALRHRLNEGYMTSTLSGLYLKIMDIHKAKNESDKGDAQSEIRDHELERYFSAPMSLKVKDDVSIGVSPNDLYLRKGIEELIDYYDLDDDKLKNVMSFIYGKYVGFKS